MKAVQHAQIFGWAGDKLRALWNGETADKDKDSAKKQNADGAADAADAAARTPAPAPPAAPTGDVAKRSVAGDASMESRAPHSSRIRPRTKPTRGGSGSSPVSGNTDSIAGAGSNALRVKPKA